MTPYNLGKKVVIDPSIPNLRFGEVKKSLYRAIGEVIESAFFKPDRCMVYKVQFPKGEELWFKEVELL